MAIENIIDWEKLPSLDEVLKLDKNLLYDNTEMQSSLNLRIVNPNLTEDERIDAEFWLNYASGLMLVTGETGGGKGIFSHMLAYKRRYYFGQLPIVDTRTREPFGLYVPFSFPFLIEMMDRIDEIEKGSPRPIVVNGLNRSDFDTEEEWDEYKSLSDEDKEQELKVRGKYPEKISVILKDYDRRKNEWTYIPTFKPHIDNATGKWLSSRGEVLLRNSTVLLDEFGSKYMPRSKPNLSSAVVLLNYFNIRRHLHALTLGIGVSLDDFNLKALDKAFWEAKCVQVDNKHYRYADNPDDLIFKVYIDQIKYNQLTGSVQKALGKTQIYIINASEPKHMLGGLGWKDIFVSENAQGMYIPRSMRKG